MNSTKSEVLPAPPNLIKSLVAGFDVISNHIGLISFSVILDLFLLFGPHASLRTLFKSYLEWVSAVSANSAPIMVEFIRTNMEGLLEVIQGFNLFSILRTLPIGIPSLIAAKVPESNPFGSPLRWEITSFGVAVLVWIGLIILGLLIGTIYFSAISQVVTTKHMDWNKIIQLLPANFFQVILLALFGFIVLVAISLPISCILPVLMTGSASLGQIVLFFYGVMLIWLLFPLIFAPFGIFIYQDRMWNSLVRGVRLARLTMPTTVLFVLSAFILSQGLGLLWNLPDERSWFLLVGVFGHAFISAGLLAAFFVYYVEAAKFISSRIQQANR